MKLLRDASGWWSEQDQFASRLKDFNIDDWLSFPDPARAIAKFATLGSPVRLEIPQLLLPLGSQEVWAAGVTYLRSKSARMGESAHAASLYDRVYEAARPELFLKATPRRCAGPGESLHLRRDSKWIVPEPELALIVSSGGMVVGFTIGNDLSCRDIEGENALYLPQAKIWDKCCGLGPAILINDGSVNILQSSIRLQIRRQGQAVFSGNTPLQRIKRTFDELTSWLFRHQTFPCGVVLLTGTGIVPPDDFTLQAGDEIDMEIPEIGKLTNGVQ